MAKVDLYNQEHSVVGQIELNDAVFGIEPHTQSMFDAVLTYRASLRQGTHQTKNRSAVRGGGRKPWRQKGTGRARQGSIRSPQWRGGGVVFGPTTEKNYKLKMNKKAARLALRSAYSVVVKDKQLFALDNIAFEAPKTKDFVSFLKNFDSAKKKTLIIVGCDHQDCNCDNVFLASRNLQRVKVANANTIAVEDLLHFDVVMMTQDAIKMVEEALV